MNNQSSSRCLPCIDKADLYIDQIKSFFSNFSDTNLKRIIICSRNISPKSLLARISSTFFCFIESAKLKNSNPT